MKGRYFASFLSGGAGLLLASVVMAVEMPAMFPIWNGDTLMLTGLSPAMGAAPADRGNVARQVRCTVNGDKENHILELMAFTSDGVKTVTLRSKVTAPLNMASPCDMIWTGAEQFGTGIAIADASMQRRYVVGRYNTQDREKFWIFVFDETGTQLWSKSLLSGEERKFGVISLGSGVGDYLNVGDGVDEIRVVSRDYMNARTYFRFFDISTGTLLKTLDVPGL